MPEPTATFAQILAAIWRSVGAKPDRETAALAQALDERLARLEAGAAADAELAARLANFERSHKQLSEVVQGLGARLGPIAEAVTASEGRNTALAGRFSALTEGQSSLRSDLAQLERGMAELARSPPAPEPGPARGMVDLVADLRGEVAQLFQAPTKGATGDGVVVEGLDVEIRGDLALGEGVGIRPYAPGKAGPEAASTIRFTLRPEVRIVPPPQEPPPPPPAAPQKSPRKKT